MLWPGFKVWTGAYDRWAWVGSGVNALLSSKRLNVDFFFFNRKVECGVTLTSNVCSFCPSPSGHLFSLPGQHPHLHPLALLWTHQHEHGRNMISRHGMYLAVMFRSGSLNTAEHRSRYFSGYQPNSFGTTKYWFVLNQSTANFSMWESIFCLLGKTTSLVRAYVCARACVC